MPQLRHQAIIQILRDDPQLVATLLGHSGFIPPSGSYPVIADSDLSHRGPDLLKELRADNVFLFRGMDETIAVVVEVQTTRPGNRRLLAWPCYVTSARAVHDCKTYMLVIATSQAASSGSETPIDIGQPGFRFLPFVAGGHRSLPRPGGIAFGPELTMLNILTGRFPLSTHDARMFALASITAASPDRCRQYSSIMLNCAPERIRLALERLMNGPFKPTFVDEIFEQGIDQGIEQGRGEEAARALFTVLAARGISVPDQARTTVNACSDLRQLEGWIARAGTASTLDEVFTA